MIVKKKKKTAIGNHSFGDKLIVLSSASRKKILPTVKQQESSRAFGALMDSEI